MFYHAALLFDYIRFEELAKPLALAVERGDIGPLQMQLNEAFTKGQIDQELVRKYGVGKSIQSVMQDITLSSSEEIASEIGLGFYFLMSRFLTPCPVSIGFNWGFLKSALKECRWSNQDIDIFLYGNPVGRLVSEQAKDAEQLGVVKHSDPYWRWIRPLYTYTHGGWIDVIGCKRFLEMLRNEASKNKPLQSELAEVANQVLKDAIEMLSIAVTEQKGLYFLILWDWEDDREE